MDDFQRQRRNLIIFSVAILMFVLAGGEIQKASILGGTIKLANSDVALWFGLIGFVYTLWRYWMYSPQLKSSLHVDYCNAHHTSVGYKKIISKHHPPMDRPRKRNHSPPVEKQSNEWVIRFNQKVIKGGGAEGMPYPNVKISTDTAYRLKMHLFLTVLFREKHLSELMLPYALAGLAIVAMGYRVICV